MIKNLTIIMILILQIQAKELVVNGNNAMVKTTKLKQTSKIYLGSFLAVGYLGTKYIYSIDAPLEGVIKYLNVKIYQKIDKNKQLVIIKSPKLLELESDYIDILIEKEYYQNEVKRLEPLYKNAVGNRY